MTIAFLGPGMFQEHNLLVRLLSLDTCIPVGKFLHFLYGSLLESEYLLQWYNSILGHMTLMVLLDWFCHNTFHQSTVCILIDLLVLAGCYMFRQDKQIDFYLCLRYNNIHGSTICILMLIPSPLS